jgi:hypothetical protein
MKIPARNPTGIATIMRTNEIAEKSGLNLTFDILAPSNCNHSRIGVKLINLNVIRKHSGFFRSLMTSTAFDIMEIFRERARAVVILEVRQPK